MNHTIDPPQDLDWDAVNDEVSNMGDYYVFKQLRDRNLRSFTTHVDEMRESLKTILYDERKYGDE